MNMDACLLESEMMDSQRDRASFKTRSQAIVVDFVSLLTETLIELVTSTSLLEVALDFHLYISTYISLIRGFRTSLEPCKHAVSKLTDLYDYDDGFAALR